MDGIKILKSLRELRPWTEEDDPMLWMYWVKMEDEFGGSYGDREPRVDPECLADTLEKLRTWLEQTRSTCRDLNLKANYEASLAYVYWFVWELGTAEAAQNHDYDPLERAIECLNRSKTYAERYGKRVEGGQFIYSEYQERLVHWVDFCEEVEVMRKTLEKIEELIEKADELCLSVTELRASCRQVHGIVVHPAPNAGGQAANGNQEQPEE